MTGDDALTPERIDELIDALTSITRVVCKLKYPNCAPTLFELVRCIAECRTLLPVKYDTALSAIVDGVARRLAKEYGITTDF